MAKNYAMTADLREKAGKGTSRALRRDSRIPAVIYGEGKEPVTVSLDYKTTSLEYHKGHMFTTLCDLAVGKDKHLVLARDVQVHPVNGNVLHVDFLRVGPKTRIKVMVPVQFINEEQSPGMSKEKGVLNVVRHEVELLCQATSIPDQIEVDMTGTQIGDAIKISKANMPEGAKPVIDDRDFTIATIAAPRVAMEVEETATEGDDAEAAAEGEAASEGDAEKKAEEGSDS